MEVDTAIRLASSIEVDTGKFVPVCELRCVKYKSVDIVANRNQITKVPYPLQKVLYEHKKN